MPSPKPKRRVPPKASRSDMSVSDSRAECSCRVDTRDSDTGHDTYYYIEWCPLHEAANELLEALKELREHVGITKSKASLRADKAITAATREDK